jgi:PAS domain S-box-containing protein
MNARDFLATIEEISLDEFQFLRVVIDAVPDPIFCKDAQGRYRLTNQAHLDRLGTTAEECIGRTVFEIPALAEFAAAYHADDLAVLTSGQPVINREEPFTSADGKRGWYLTSKYPLRNAKGDIVGLVGIARNITERRMAEQRLAQERGMLETLLNAIPDPLFFKDLEGRHLLFNRANAEKFGLTDENYIGKTAHELPIPKEHADLYAADDQRVISTGEPVINREEPYEGWNGRSGWFLTSKFPIRDAEGHITGLVGICRDISDRKEVERKLANERSFLKTLLDAIPDLLFVKDLSGRHLLLTAADKSFVGTDAQFGVGKTVFDLPIPPEVAERYATDDRWVMETGQPLLNKEEPFVKPDGSRGWFLTSKLPMRDENGEITGLIGISRDITQLKRDRDELEQARQRLLDHMENSPLAVIEWKPDFTVSYWGGRAKDIFGWRFDEISGRHFSDWPFVHADDIPHVAEISNRLIDGRDPRNVCHNRNIRKDGEILHCVWHNSVLHDSEGRIVSILSLVQDVTGQVRAQDAARRAHEERLALESQLQEMQKLESLGVLAGGVAHDFNNLLTGILGNATLAASELPEDAPLRAHLAQIEAAASRAADLCKQMLAYSGKGRFDLRTIDLDRVIEDSNALLRASVGKKADFTIQLAGNLPPIQADAAEIRQVVMNLVLNAAEALGDLEGAIRLQTGIMRADKKFFAKAHLSPDLPEGTYVFLEVADTGCGMTPDIRSRIFDPFYTTKFTGRGLGLPAVLGIVRGHDGALRVESLPGRGTTIRALFPAAAGKVEKPRSASPKDSAWRGAGLALLIDDEAVVQDTVSQMLKSIGFGVQLATDGQAGVDQFRATPDAFALVMLDLTMPRLNGDEVHRILRELRPNLPVVVMSGYSEQEISNRFGTHAPAAFLQKPFRLPDLRETLRTILTPGT